MGFCLSISIRPYHRGCVVCILLPLKNQSMSSGARSTPVALHFKWMSLYWLTYSVPVIVNSETQKTMVELENWNTFDSYLKHW